MTWYCAAIDHGLTIYSDGRIAPCCMIDDVYHKQLSNYHLGIFQDLKGSTPPSVCWKCTQSEQFGKPSYRQGRNRTSTNRPGLQFLDLRNSNVCNLKCRSCYEGNSSLIAKEKGITPSVIKSDISARLDDILSPSLNELYYTGGEPLINPEHWQILERLIDLGLAPNIDLKYNTNLTTLRYKALDISQVWTHFHSVSIGVSIDAVGTKLGWIRSGADWTVIEQNLFSLKTIQQRNPNISSRITCTVSLLNIWFVAELLLYAKTNGWTVELNQLEFPLHYSLRACPDRYRSRALLELDTIDRHGCYDGEVALFRSMIMENTHQHLFDKAMTEIKHHDLLRDENLWSILPFANETELG